MEWMRHGWPFGLLLIAAIAGSSYGDELAVAEDGRGISVSNRSIRIIFGRPEENFALRDVVKKDTGVSFLCREDAAGADELWSLILVADAGRGERLTVRSNALAETSWEAEETDEGLRLLLHWKNIDIEEEKDVLDVTVRVDLKKGDDLTYWRMFVDDRSPTYGIWEAFLPVMYLAPIRNEPTSTHLVFPERSGRVIPDPFHCEIFEDGQRYSTTFPGSMAIQCTAIYQDTGDGLYWGIYDGLGYEKRFYHTVFRRRNCLRIDVGHAPDDMGLAPIRYRMAYPVVVGVFDGDWYDACRIYRKWALQQEWSRKGPLTGRTDIPQWFLRSAVVLHNSSNNRKWDKAIGQFSREEARELVARNLEGSLRALDILGPDIFTLWYSWQRYDANKTMYQKSQFWPCSGLHNGGFPPPKEGVEEAVAAMKKKGGHVTAYVNTVLFDYGIDGAEEAKPWVSRDPWGKLQIYGAKEPCWDMCRYTTWWQQRYAAIARWLVRDHGMNGIYMDSYGRMQRRCFATTHGHSYGGGVTQVVGQRTFATVVREAVRTENPDTILLSENNAECFNDLIDAKLLDFGLYPYFAPLFQAVYHDYFMTFGRHLSIQDIEKEPVFSMLAGNLFVTGAKIGQFRPYRSDFFLVNPKCKKWADYIRLLVEYKKNLTEYLTLGEMLRPITFSPPLPRITSPAPWKVKGPVTMPVVFSAVYREPHGKVGMVFTNVGDQDVDVHFMYDLTPYLNGKTCRASEVERDGTRIHLGVKNAAPFTYAGCIKEHAVLCLELGEEVRVD